jgi:AraC-like DNA-binding protein
MDPTGLNRLIESMTVRFQTAEIRKVIKPVYLKNTVEPKCVLVKVLQGNFYAGPSLAVLPVHSFYFVPAGQVVHFQHGRSESPAIFENEGFASASEREMYLKPLNGNVKIRPGDDVFSIIGFDVSVYNTIPFFKLLGLKAFTLPAHHELSVLMDLMIKEQRKDQIGKGSMINSLLKEMVIHIIRLTWNQPKLKSLFENLNALLDVRLIHIIQYIEENLAGDLSNNKIADIAHISTDYVGQFFKNYMGVNLQDYIENKRLEKAYQLLRTTTDNIQSISVKVGFRDQAYFSRRFKMKFGTSAKEIRKMGHSFI